MGKAFNALPEEKKLPLQIPVECVSNQKHERIKTARLQTYIDIIAQEEKYLNNIVNYSYLFRKIGKVD